MRVTRKGRCIIRVGEGKGGVQAREREGSERRGFGALGRRCPCLLNPYTFVYTQTHTRALCL